MTDKTLIRAVVAADFSDKVMQRLREISPLLHIERHFPEVPESAMANAEILYTIRHFPEPAQAPRLRWVQLHYSGVDRALRHAIIQAEDVEVTTASGIHAVNMAEYCLGMMLAFMYKLPRLLALQAEAKWPENPHEIFRPRGLRGLTLGIAGYGSIGRELARMAQTMGMKILVSKRDVMHTAEVDGYIEPGTGDPTGDIPDRFYPPQALATMARECDFLVVATPLTKETQHSINEQILKAMKPTAVLINVARGGVIDEAALVEALKANRIAGAALDVFEEEPLPVSSPLWKLENVIISPHVSGNSDRYNDKAADLFAENLRRYVEKRSLLNVVNRGREY